MPIVAPIGGHVLRKNIVEGQYVQEGQAMFEVTDVFLLVLDFAVKKRRWR
jgi:hypothetical protein